MHTVTPEEPGNDLHLGSEAKIKVFEIISQQFSE
jgi:hypothetical protein